MITKITNTKEKYADQFKAINAALADIGSEVRINSLEDYFSNVRTIASLTKKGSNVKGKFLLMPLDEPFFEIDANARTIKVPDNFKKNGIAVQNDHWAEILYFKVDRFYDYQDLASLNIFINWEFTPSGGKNANTEKLINVTKAFAPDPDFLPNYLVFGWVVSKEMTQTKGTLRFSITFSDSTIPGFAQGYQLSTGITSVNVNEGLSPAEGTVPITFNDYDFFARITNSAIHSGGVDTVLGQPIWKALPVNSESKLKTADNRNLFVYSVGEELSSTTMTKVYFPVVEDIEGLYKEEDNLLLAAEAVTKDLVDSVDYLWDASYLTPGSDISNIADVNFETISLSDNLDVVYELYVETKDTAPRIDTTYYRVNSLSNTIESVTDNTILLKMFDPEDTDYTGPIYETVCVRNVERGGYYTVKAQSTALRTIYEETEDTAVLSGKTYYELVNEAMIEVNAPTGNPKQEGWYELTKKTCNSPILYSNKYIYIPNAEIPDLKISRTNKYIPRQGIDMNNYDLSNNGKIEGYLKDIDSIRFNDEYFRILKVEELTNLGTEYYSDSEFNVVLTIVFFKELLKILNPVEFTDEYFDNLKDTNEMPYSKDDPELKGILERLLNNALYEDKLRYEITNPNTIYNYIPLESSDNYLPMIHVDLGIKDDPEAKGIGGICYKFGFEDYVNKVSSTTSVQQVLDGSADHSNEDFKYVGDYVHTTQLDINNYVSNDTSDIAKPGDYYLRVFNQKNHTYSVTDLEKVMSLSYAAPKMTDVDVYVYTGEDGEDRQVKVLSHGEALANTSDTLGNINTYTMTDINNTFVKILQNLSDDTIAMLANYNDTITYEYNLQEVAYEDYSYESNNGWESRKYRYNFVERSNDEYDSTNLLPIDFVSPIKLNQSDTGFYRIQIKAYYHDSVLISYTDIFLIQLAT